MFSATVSRPIDVSAETAWNLLVDWGNTDWLPGPESTEVVTNGNQVTRKLHMKGVRPIEETMLSHDPQARTIEYTIAVGDVFKLENYRGHICVAAEGNHCRIDWSCSFDPGAMSEEQADQVARGNMKFLLDSLQQFLEAPGQG